MTRLGELLQAYQDRDPAARSKLEIFLLYPGVWATIYYRFAHWLYGLRLLFLARLVSQWGRFWTGIEIHPAAQIGRRFVIDHGHGVVVGATCEIGDDCLIYQGVTLGGTGKDTGKRHPTLGNNVMVGAGAKVLGPFRVGDNSLIAAGAVVLNEVPSDSTAVGVPARLTRREGQRVKPDEEKKDFICDPFFEEITGLWEHMQCLEAQLQERCNDEERTKD